MKRIVLIFAATFSLAAQTATFPGAAATDAQLKLAKNRCQTTLRGSISAVDTVITVADATCIAANMLLTVDSETVSVTSVSGNNLTVVRAFDSSTAAAHSSGRIIADRIVAWHHNALKQEIKAIETYLLGFGAGSINNSGALEGDWVTGTGIETPQSAAMYRGSLATPSTDSDPVVTISKIDASAYNDGVGVLNLYGNKRGGDEGMEILTIGGRQTNSPSNLVGAYSRLVMDQGTSKTIGVCENLTPIRCTTTAAHGAISNTTVTISGNAAANGTWLITVVDSDTYTLNGSTANGAVGGGTAVHYGTGWAFVGSCQKLNQYDKCSVVEINPNNQSGVDAGYLYTDGGLMNGLAIAGQGTAKNTSALEILATAPAEFRTGIRFGTGSIVTDNYAVRLANRTRIGSLLADGTTESALLYVDGSNNTILNSNSAGFLYLAVNNTGKAWLDSAGKFVIGTGNRGQSEGLAFAALGGAAPNGEFVFCTDCTVTSGADNTCAASGSGSFAFRINGVWRCFNAQN